MITNYLGNMTVNELLHYKKRLQEILDQIINTLNEKEVNASDQNI